MGMTNTRTNLSQSVKPVSCGSLVFLYLELLLSAFLLTGCQKLPTGVGGALPKTYPPIGKVDITMRAQEESLWCWAASAQMVLEWADKQGLPLSPLGSIRQCDQVTYYVAKYPQLHVFVRNCCPSPSLAPLPDCNVTGLPDDSFKHATLKFTPMENNPLSPEQIKEEVSNHRPIAFSWKYAPKYCPPCGHMMVIVGYTQGPDSLTLAVYDPDPVSDPTHNKPGGTKTSVTYEDFVGKKPELGKTPNYTHYRDYYGFGTKP